MSLLTSSQIANGFAHNLEFATVAYEKIESLFEERLDTALNLAFDYEEVIFDKSYAPPTII